MARPVEAAVPLLGKALTDEHRQVRWLAENALSRLGQELTAEEAATLEAHVGNGPHELAFRILLLAYYIPGQRKSETSQTARQRHLLWLIQNAPASSTAGTPVASILKKPNPLQYEEAKQLWLKQVELHSDNPQVLGNAARFFTLNDAKQCESLLQQAQVLEPQNPEWPRRLAHLYSLQVARSPSDSPNFAQLALDTLKEAEALRELALDDEFLGDSPEMLEANKIAQLMERERTLCDLAKAAVTADQFEDAERYGNELLALAESEEVPEFFREDSNATFYGHFVLGMCALNCNEIEQAKQHLLASATIQGSATLSSFGPNMSLAKGLLERGEHDVVLQFFDLCQAFWEMHDDRLHQWAEVVRQGNMPDFGPNLHY
ncbi:hypothetical protein [Blastopirellula marina]|uniref:RNA polymerase subunit sigma-24 n=1 Tax=Blastopirellula marina TaxID=124 RepID=A0A2S8G8Z4_9BACT|nr:hypothetical protein [Blastopirellula marina]PQO40932.1 hypothetical protein C5Y98_04960 [Blastopirellula marina]PTL45814.1 hypothetical protein C5Y97_04960 [Blastopirellula marina]